MKSEKNSLLRAWPIYAICLGLIAAMFYVSTKHPDKHKNTSLGNSITKNIAGDKVEFTDMQSIIDARQTWDPVMMDWYGKETPDFDFTDISGADHKLSDFRGKNVILVFWATWSPASYMEIPHLMKLREDTPNEQLEIIAFSNEDEDKLRTFARGRGINYTVVSIQQAIPSPFCPPYLREIPSSFYIDAQGAIILAAEGIVPYGYATAIIECMSDTDE
jgi:peroxiredoxin